MAHLRRLLSCFQPPRDLDQCSEAPRLVVQAGGAEQSSRPNRASTAPVIQPALQQVPYAGPEPAPKSPTAAHATNGGQRNCKTRGSFEAGSAACEFSAGPEDLQLASTTLAVGKTTSSGFLDTGCHDLAETFASALGPRPRMSPLEADIKSRSADEADCTPGGTATTLDTAASPGTPLGLGLFYAMRSTDAPMSESAASSDASGHGAQDGRQGPPGCCSLTQHIRYQQQLGHLNQQASALPPPRQTSSSLSSHGTHVSAQRLYSPFSAATTEAELNGFDAEFPQRPAPSNEPPPHASSNGGLRAAAAAAASQQQPQQVSNMCARHSPPCSTAVSVATAAAGIAAAGRPPPPHMPEPRLQQQQQRLRWQAGCEPDCCLYVLPVDPSSNNSAQPHQQPHQQRSCQVCSCGSCTAAACGAASSTTAAASITFSAATTTSRASSASRAATAANTATPMGAAAAGSFKRRSACAATPYSSFAIGATATATGTATGMGMGTATATGALVSGMGLGSLHALSTAALPQVHRGLQPHVASSLGASGLGMALAGLPAGFAERLGGLPVGGLIAAAGGGGGAGDGGSASVLGYQLLNTNDSTGNVGMQQLLRLQSPPLSQPHLYPASARASRSYRRANTATPVSGGSSRFGTLEAAAAGAVPAALAAALGASGAVALPDGAMPLPSGQPLPCSSSPSTTIPAGTMGRPFDLSMGSSLFSAGWGASIGGGPCGGTQERLLGPAPGGALAALMQAALLPEPSGSEVWGQDRSLLSASQQPRAPLAEAAAAHHVLSGLVPLPAMPPLYQQQQQQQLLPPPGLVPAPLAALMPTIAAVPAFGIAAAAVGVGAPAVPAAPAGASAAAPAAAMGSYVAPSTTDSRRGSGSGLERTLSGSRLQVGRPFLGMPVAAVAVAPLAAAAAAATAADSAMKSSACPSFEIGPMCGAEMAEGTSPTLLQGPAQLQLHLRSLATGMSRRELSISVPAAAGCISPDGSVAMAAAAEAAKTAAAAVAAVLAEAQSDRIQLHTPDLESCWSDLRDLTFIGSGASGNVYSGTWCGVPVAVKFMLSGDRDELQRQQREAALSRLASHPHLVQTYAVAAAQLMPAHFAASIRPSELQRRASGLTNTDLLGTCAAGGTAAELYGTGTLSRTLSVEMGRQSQQSVMGTAATMATGPLAAIAAAAASAGRAAAPEESPAKKRATGTLLAGLGGKPCQTAVAVAAATGRGRAGAEQPRSPAPAAPVPGAAYDRLSPVSPAMVMRSGGAASCMPLMISATSPAAALPAPRGVLAATASFGAAAGQLRSPALTNPSGGSYAWRTPSQRRTTASSGRVSGGVASQCPPTTVLSTAISTVDEETVAAQLETGASVAGKRVARSDDSFDLGSVEGRGCGPLACVLQMSDVLAHIGARPGLWLTVVIMEVMDRGSLHRCIHGGGIFTPGQSTLEKRHRVRGMVRTLVEVAQGMAHLHASGLVHGDLKPANVLLKNASRDLRGFSAKVSDFGVSRPLPDGKPAVVSAEEWGTVIYTAPEVFNGSICAASDVFSFGVLTWHLTTGKLPHEDLNPFAVMFAVAKGELQLEWPSNVPKPLRKLGELCMAHDPAARPTFNHIVRALMKLETRMREVSASSPVALQPAGGGSVSASRSALSTAATLHPPSRSSQVQPPQHSHSIGVA